MESGESFVVAFTGESQSRKLSVGSLAMLEFLVSSLIMSALVLLGLKSHGWIVHDAIVVFLPVGLLSCYSYVNNDMVWQVT